MSGEVIEARGAAGGGLLGAALVDARSLAGAVARARAEAQRYVCLHDAGIEPDGATVARLAEALEAEDGLAGCAPVLLRRGEVAAAGGRFGFAPGLCRRVTRRPAQPEACDWLPGLGVYERSALEACGAGSLAVAPALVAPLVGLLLGRARRRVVCLPFVAQEISGELPAARGRALWPLLRRTRRPGAWLAFLCFEAFG